MRFKTAITSTAAILVAVAMLTAAVTTGALAAPSVTTDSDLQPTESTTIDPSTDEVEKLEFNVTNTNTSSVTVTVTNNATGTQLAQVSDTDAALSEVSTDTWVANLSHSDLNNDSEMTVGNESEIKVTIDHTHDDNGDGTDTTATTTNYHNVTPVSTSDRQVVLLGAVTTDSDTFGPDVTVDEASDGFFGIGEESHDTYTSTENHPNGDFNYDNATYKLTGAQADAFADATGASDAASGDATIGATVLVAGELVPFYVDSAGDLHDSNESHAVFNSSTDEIVVEFGDDRTDSYATDVTVASENPGEHGLSFNQVRETYGYGAAIDMIVPFDIPSLGPNVIVDAGMLDAFTATFGPTSIAG